jgi:hypothetical protein
VKKIAIKKYLKIKYFKNNCRFGKQRSLVILILKIIFYFFKNKIFKLTWQKKININFKNSTCSCLVIILSQSDVKLYNQGTNAKYLRIARENFIKIYITGVK